jgi:prolipoprotein diacylglyceryltransferase
MGMLLSTPMIAAGVIIMVFAYRKAGRGTEAPD